MKPKHKKLTIRVLIDIAMYGTLIATLFPIFWMVFTSLKSNNDILTGKLAFSKRSNAIVSLYNDDNRLIFGSADGYIGSLNKNVVKKISDRHDEVGIHLLSQDSKIIYSHAMGISEISGDRIRPLFQFKDIPWKVRRNVKSTFLVAADGKYYLSKTILRTDAAEGRKYKGQDRYEGINVFDKNFQLIRSIGKDEGLTETSVTDMKQDGHHLWISGLSGVYVLDTKTDKVIATYSEDDGLSIATVQCLAIKGPGLVYAGSKTTLYLIDFNKDQVSEVVTDPRFAQINTLTHSGTNIFLGTPNGLFTYHIDSRKLSVDFENRAEYWAIQSIARQDSHLQIGFDDGSVKVFAAHSLSSPPSEQTKIRAGKFDIRWENYLDMWENISFGTYFKNSLIICTITVLISLGLATMAGYALSRFNFPGSSIFSTAILSINMIPMLLFLIPIYLMFIKLFDLTGIQLIGTYTGIIFVYSTFFVPMSIWILRSFFVSIPIDIEEAARIDGCSRWGTFWRIALPLAAPGIIATGIYLFIVAWDELMFATILLPKESSFTIPLGIKLFIGNHQNRFDLIMAASTVATLPVLILFFLVQKWFIKGLTAGAVKG